MKAYAFVETYSKGIYSDKPVHYFVLRYDLISSVKSGIGENHTTDSEKFKKMLIEEANKGVKIETDKLPRSVEPLEKKVLDDKMHSKIEVDVIRIPLSKVA